MFDIIHKGALTVERLFCYMKNANTCDHIVSVNQRINPSRAAIIITTDKQATPIVPYPRTLPKILLMRLLQQVI